MRALVLLVLSALLLGAPLARAEDEADDAALVRALLQQLHDGDRAEACERLEALGAERVVPHLGLVDLPASLRWEALQLLVKMGSADDIYRNALAGMRHPDSELRMEAIELLGGALANERISFRQAWWRDLLLAYHGTEVIVLDGFYSGPGFPSWNLRDMVLRPQVHGGEKTLTRLTTDEDWRVRLMATGFLGCTTQGRTDAVERALVARLEDEHPTVRRMAVDILCEAEWTGALEAVAARLHDPQEEEAVRLAAARELVFLDRERAGPHALRALRSPLASIRAAAASTADALFWVGREFVWSDEAASGLVAALRDEAPDVRHEAASSILGVGPWDRASHLAPADLRFLLETLANEDACVGAAAARVLMGQGRLPDAAVPRLVDWLESRVFRVRQAAFWGLASLRARATRALPALRAVAHDRDFAHEARRTIEAIEMASMPGNDLDALLTDPDLDVRLRGVREILRRKDRVRLLRALEDRDPEVVITAAEGVCDDPAFAKVCVDAVLSAVEVGARGRHAGLLVRLGDRVLPHRALLLEAYRADPDAYFDLLASVPRLRAAFAAVVWAELVGSTAEASVGRAAGILESLHGPLRTALRDGPTKHRGRALQVLEAGRQERVCPLLPDLEALVSAALEDAEAKERARGLLEKNAPTPHWADLDLR